MKVGDRELINDYFSKSQNILASISSLEVVGLVEAIQAVRLSRNTIYIAGNGGSASTASHFATDLGVGSIRRNNPVRAVSLCENSSVITALSNDVSYEFVFADQLLLLAQPGDLLVVISASGNSQNLIKAIEVANKFGVTSYSLTGFNGGKLKEITHGRNVHVQSDLGEYGLVEDAHLAICHVITECIRQN